jgi:glycosyltransferase involved in cell wall biosynthesis
VAGLGWLLEAAVTNLRLVAIENDPDLSVVIPVHNEADNVGHLAAEVVAALRGKTAFEIVFVDDGSTDGTAEALLCLATLHPELRSLAHDRKSGQSIAVASGVRAARGETIVTIDGDGQNDPKFILEMARTLAAGQPEIGLVAGRRLGRKASGFKKLQSRIANVVRGAILRDGTTDTGCGLKAFPRALFLRLPVFDGLHRFLPALVRREGFAIAQVDVIDRDRRHGVSKYGMWDRLWVGLMDLAGVWWLIRRRKSVPNVKELSPDVDRSVADGRELFAGRVRQ